MNRAATGNSNAKRVVAQATAIKRRALQETREKKLQIETCAELVAKFMSDVHGGKLNEWLILIDHNAQLVAISYHGHGDRLPKPPVGEIV